MDVWNTPKVTISIIGTNEYGETLYEVHRESGVIAIHGYVDVNGFVYIRGVYATASCEINRLIQLVSWALV